MGKKIDVAGTKDEATAELQRVLAQATLPMPAGRGPIPCPGVISPQQMEHGCLPQANRSIGLALVVDQ